MNEMHTASHWSAKKGNYVECGLCPHHCSIPEGGVGICGVRKNVGGELGAIGYGIYPAVHMDPIEKKPLNHFLPGSSILSLGSVGCNLRCRHCQNWSLARASPDGLDENFLPVKDLLGMSSRDGSIGVAFTYNEPSINFEYIMEAAPALRKKGSNVVLVTNGYLEKGPWRELMEHTDGANIDVKGFTEEFYSQIAGGRLQPVLDNVRTAFEMGVHIEIAYLVIPGYNDDDEQIEGFVRFMVEKVSPDVPVHFNRFHPDHLMLDVPSTPVSTLVSIREKAREGGMNHVFIGNVAGKEFNDTICPGCGKTVIKRGWFSATSYVKNGKCRWCGRKIYGKWT